MCVCVCGGGLSDIVCFIYRPLNCRESRKANEIRAIQGWIVSIILILPPSPYVLKRCRYNTHNEPLMRGALTGTDKWHGRVI